MIFSFVFSGIGDVHFPGTALTAQQCSDTRGIVHVEKRFGLRFYVA